MLMEKQEREKPYIISKQDMQNDAVTKMQKYSIHGTPDRILHFHKPQNVITKVNEKAL